MTVDDRVLRDGPLVWDGPRVWDDEVDSTLVLLQRRSETPDVTTFVFGATEPRYFDFEPGQYLTFRFTIEGVPVERCYTISSAPTRPFTVAITVKRQPGGRVSEWLHDRFSVGDAVDVQGPLGQFTIGLATSNKVLLLSAGSGITPMMAMLRTVYDLAQPLDVAFVHSARSPQDIIFRSELSQIASGSPHVSVTHICEADSVREHWQGHRGRVSAQILEQVAPDLHERDVFVCGPAPYMSAVRDTLANAGFDMTRCHHESFDVFDVDATDVTTAAPVVTTETAAVMHSVTFVRSGRVIECSADTNVLEAAYAAGLTLPSSCAQGVCGTCKVTMLSGDVDMNHNGGIRPKEVRLGKILLCCSTPSSALEIDA